MFEGSTQQGLVLFRYSRVLYPASLIALPGGLLQSAPVQFRQSG